jgi:hypothetical protein
MAGSQSLTTITSVTTTTHQVTSTSYRTSAVKTTTATYTATLAIFNPTTVTVDAAKPRTCYIRSFRYNGTAGQRLQGKWTSNYVINFYVMSESDYANYKYCGEPGSTYVTIEMATAYSLNWIVPTSEALRFIFENYAAGSDLASARTVTFALYKVGPQSSVSVLYSTTSARLTIESTVTLTSLHYSTVNQPLVIQTGPAAPSMPPIALMIVGIVIGIILVVAIVAVLKREKTGSSGKRRRRKLGKERNFCINCGAELPLKSKFCNKCGSAQS